MTKDLIAELRDTNFMEYNGHPEICTKAAGAIELLMNEIDFLDDHRRKDKKQIEKLERIAQKQSDELNVLRGSIANYQVGVHEARIAELEAALKHVDEMCMSQPGYHKIRNCARAALGEKE